MGAAFRGRATGAPWAGRGRSGPPRLLALRRLHRWLGLAVGGWFALLGLTGALLVFWPEIETRHIPSPGPGAPLALPALAAAAAAALPEAPDGPLRVWPPAAPGATFRADFRLPEGRTSLHLDPASGAVLGEVRWGGQVIHTVYGLHRNLLIDGGERLVGLAAGLPILGLLLAGGLLWARRDAVPWREKLVSVAALRGRRRLANHHRVLGLRALLPLLVAVVTGLALAFPKTTQRLLWQVTAVTLPRPAPPITLPGAGPLDLAGAIALAEARRPGWRPVWLDLPHPAAPAQLTLALAPPEAWPGDEAVIAVDLATGALRDTAPYPAGRLAAWFTALHAGTAFGLAHRLLVVVVGLLPLGVGGLGLALWVRSRANRRQVRARAAA